MRRKPINKKYYLGIFYRVEYVEPNSYTFTVNGVPSDGVWSTSKDAERGAEEIIERLMR